MRIVCFGSGDFPVETFKALVEKYEVVGFVTSKDKTIFGNERVYDLAVKNNIPVYVPEKLDDVDFLKWLDKINGEIYCVISYKFLPVCVTSKCDFAFNIHASLLPLLKGSAPINWAIRYGFKRTGITAIELSDKIDCGNILSSYGVDIEETDNFETLHNKLSEASVAMTLNIIEKLKEGVKIPMFEQPVYPSELDSDVFHAPKLTKENTTYKPYGVYSLPNGKTIHNMIRSMSPKFGVTFNLDIDKYDYVSNEIYNVRKISFKVYESELLFRDEHMPKQKNGSEIITDWKTYLYIAPLSDNEYVVSLKKIQVPGKKILNVKEFLKGFQNFKNNDFMYIFV